MKNNVGTLFQTFGSPPKGLRDRLVFEVIDFVYVKLSCWRDDPKRPYESAEKKLNSQLCTYLNFQTRLEEKLYMFSAEEFQKGERQVE